MSLTKDYGTYIVKDGITYMDEKIIEGLHMCTLEVYGGLKGKNRTLGSICHDAFYQEDKTIENLAAYYLSRIVKGHPFSDGNKRTGFLTSVAFLGANRMSYKIADGELAAAEIATIAAARNMDQAYEYSKLFVEGHIDNPMYGGPYTEEKNEFTDSVEYILSGI